MDQPEHSRIRAAPFAGAESVFTDRALGWLADNRARFHPFSNDSHTKDASKRRESLEFREKASVELALLVFYLIRNTSFASDYRVTDSLFFLKELYAIPEFEERLFRVDHE